MTLRAQEIDGAAPRPSRQRAAVARHRNGGPAVERAHVHSRRGRTRSTHTRASRRRAKPTPRARRPARRGAAPASLPPGRAADVAVAGAAAGAAVFGGDDDRLPSRDQDVGSITAALPHANRSALPLPSAGDRHQCLRLVPESDPRAVGGPDRGDAPADVSRRRVPRSRSIDQTSGGAAPMVTMALRPSGDSDNAR